MLWLIFKHLDLKNLHSISLFFRRARPPLGMARSVAVASSVLGTGIIVWWAWQLGVLQGAVPRMFPWGPGPWQEGVDGRAIGSVCAHTRVLITTHAIFSASADTKVKKRTVALSTPLKRKEEFSLFKVSDDEYKVKISPQLLLATQRFLSRGEGEGWSLPLVSPPRGSRNHPDQTPAWLLVSWRLSKSICFLLQS